MAVLTRQQKMDRRGIIHFEVDEVFAFLSAKQSADLDLTRKLRPLVGAVALLASHIRARMAFGRGATGQIPWKRSKKPYGIITGGMWKGVQAQGVGKKDGAISFGGQSQASARFLDMRERDAAAKGKVLGKRAAETFRNDLKASGLWARKKFNPIEASADETAAMAEAIGIDMAQQIYASLKGKSEPIGASRGNANKKLRASLAAHWRG